MNQHKRPALSVRKQRTPLIDCVLADSNRKVGWLYRGRGTPDQITIRGKRCSDIPGGKWRNIPVEDIVDIGPSAEEPIIFTVDDCLGIMTIGVLWLCNGRCDGIFNMKGSGDV